MTAFTALFFFHFLHFLYIVIPLGGISEYIIYPSGVFVKYKKMHRISDASYIQ